MIWLRCYEKYDCVAEFELNSSSLKKHSQEALGKNFGLSIDGWFSQMEQGIFIFYKYENNIVFRAYDKEFVLDDKTTIHVSGPRELRKLQIIRDNIVIHETFYSPPGEGMIKGDPTPFVEEEHFDIGLFVSNISKDPKRKARLLGKE